MLNRLLQNLFGFERPETPGEIAFFRLFEAMIGWWVVSFVWNWAPYIQRIDDVVLPLGIANYLDVSFFFEAGWSYFVAGVATVGIVLGFFRLWRWGYFLALAAFHLQYASRYSLGEISHGSNVIGITLLCLALGMVAYRDLRDARRFAIGLTLFLVGFGYTSAAFCKLIASGPLWVDGSHLWMWIEERAVDTYSMSGIRSVNGLQELALSSYPVATAILTFGLLTELFGFAMWYRRSRRVIVLLLLGMHIGILISMRINFPANNALLAAFAVPWAPLIDRFFGRLKSETLERVRTLLPRLA